MISPTSFASSLESSLTTTGLASQAAVSRQEAVHDAELVKRFHAGDDAAFVEIVTRYRGKMFSIALSLPAVASSCRNTRPGDSRPIPGAH